MKPAPTPPDTDDRYVPGHGDTTFDVEHYDLVLDYALEGNRLSARATLTAVARGDLDRLSLDLHHLRVTKVTVDGEQAAKYAHRKDKLVVRPRSALSEGTTFTVVVTYEGSPRPMPGLDGDAGWEELTDGVIVASQPHGAPSFFPCNDRPSNKATYRFRVTTPSDYVVLCNGTLADKKRRAAVTSWTFTESAPMATYLATVQIGRYASITAGGDVALRTLCPVDRQEESAEAFGRQPEMMALFVSRFGPYPFAGYTAVVTEDDLEIPLEAQGLSVFGASFISPDWDSQRLIAHEMAHQWFGNSVTLRHWRDIWLHEGFACYAEWLWSEESGGPSAHERAEEAWRGLAEQDQDLLLADPGPDLMFDDRVYKRGALLLHALRLTVGDEDFFDLLRTWTERHRHGSATTDQLIALTAELCGAEVGGLYDAWLRELSLPALPG